MKKKNGSIVLHILFFAFVMAVFGPYHALGLSAALAVCLLASVCLRPGSALTVVAAYLIAGLWLPIYPGSQSGGAFLFGESGGFLLAMILCVLAIAAMKEQLKKSPALSVFLGLCVALVFYIGFGTLWYVVRSESSLKSAFDVLLIKRCLLFVLNAVAVFCAAPTVRKTIR